MSQTRTVVVERQHDYLYDRLYQLSSERDHARATYKSNISPDKIQMVPNYPTMFSDLNHYPRQEVRIITKDSVPKFISRHWRGTNDQANLIMKSILKLRDTSALGRRAVCSYVDSVEVGGKDRFRYFRRPIIPFASQIPPDVVLATKQSENIYQFTEEDMRYTPTKSRGTQTIFRDSEAQTVPYTPEYIVQPGEAPEVLTLASLTCGRGLPAGLHEVEMIDRARHRRNLEAQLPPLNDFSQSEKRRKMMDAIETEEWVIREKEIEELQRLRLEVLIKLLRQREEAFQEMSNQKLDRIWNKKQEEKENIFYKLRLKYIKAIRQLLKSRKSIENKHMSRGIISEYSDFSSQTWAPLTRIGQFLDKNSQQSVVNSRFLTTYNGLLELEESLPDYVLNPKITAPIKNQYTAAGYKKRKYREQDKLKGLHESIKKTTSTDQKVEKPLRFLQKIEKPVPRPPTPTIVIPNENEEDKGREIILLQQIIRGRAIQAMMFEGKQKRKELIEELRSTHSLLSNEMEIDKQEKAKVISLQRQRLLLEHRENHIDESLSYLEGESMGEIFDFLSKELLRVQEERRIHAFSLLAERERRIREAEESGLRQVEERRRREQDEIFKQMVKVNQATVDTYLKDIIDFNIDWSASHISKMEIEQLAQKINEESYETELTNTRLQQEEIVADLIHNFLIPEVHKQSIQEKIERCQRKFLVSAHKEIFNVTEEVVQTESVTEAQNHIVENEINEPIISEKLEEKSVMTNEDKEEDYEEDQKLESKEIDLEENKNELDSEQLANGDININEKIDKGCDNQDSELESRMEYNDNIDLDHFVNGILNSEEIYEEQELQNDEGEHYDDHNDDDIQERLTDSHLGDSENISVQNEEEETKDDSYAESIKED